MHIVNFYLPLWGGKGEKTNKQTKTWNLYFYTLTFKREKENHIVCFTKYISESEMTYRFKRVRRQHSLLTVIECIVLNCLL